MSWNANGRNVAPNVSTMLHENVVIKHRFKCKRKTHHVKMCQYYCIKIVVISSLMEDPMVKICHQFCRKTCCPSSDRTQKEDATGQMYHQYCVKRLNMLWYNTYFNAKGKSIGPNVSPILHTNGCRCHDITLMSTQMEGASVTIA